MKAIMRGRMQRRLVINYLWRLLVKTLRSSRGHRRVLSRPTRPLLHSPVPIGGRGRQAAFGGLAGRHGYRARALGAAEDAVLRVDGVRVVDELGLDGGGVNALVVKELLDVLGHLHVLAQVEAADVRRGDDPVGRQLPDVEVVDCQNAIDVAQQLLFEDVHVYVGGHGLEQD